MRVADVKWSPPSRLRAAELASALLLLLAVACVQTPEVESDRPAAEPALETHEKGFSFASEGGSFASLTFNGDIAHILYSRCVSCHRPGEIAPFPLLSYADVRRRSEEIELVTQSGYMPPWQPESGHGEFENARGLTTDERAMIREWIRQGAPQGDGEPPLIPELTPGWQLGEPDLVVSLPEAYTVDAELGDDIFRNFVIPLDVEEQVYVTAVEVRPHNRRLVHHAAIKTDTTGRARQFDELDPEPGYSGMVVTVAPGGHYLGWTPGRIPAALGEGMAWQLERGMDLVVEAHLLPTGKPESLQISIGLFLSDEPPTRFPASIHLGSTTLDIPAGDSSYRIRDEFTVPVDVEALTVYPHAHYLGKEVRVSATLPGGELESLLWIRDWDFNWQDEYSYERPVSLPAGSVIRLEISYDNSADNVRNPSHPPKRVWWGPQSGDEMGDLWLKVIPRNPTDLPRLQNAILRKDLQLRRDGYQGALEREPQDFHSLSDMGSVLVLDHDVEGGIPYLKSALEIEPAAWQVHLTLANALLQLDDLEGSIHHFRLGVRPEPGFEDAYVNLAVALSRSGQAHNARTAYRQALLLEPDNAVAHSNFAGLLTEMGEFGDAFEHYRRALEIEPGSAQTHKNLANALAREGRIAESIASLERVVALDPADGNAHHYLGQALASVGRTVEAARYLQRTIELQSGNATAHFHLGFALAQMDRHAEAVRYFRASMDRQSFRDPEVHYNLALSLLEIGQTGEATAYLEATLQAEPGHAGARARLDDLRGRPTSSYELD